MNLVSKDVLGINQALKSKLILKSFFGSLGGHRKVILIDPREEPECDTRIYGFGNDGTFEISLITASKSYLENGKLAGPIYGCCAVEHCEQSFSDRFLTAGGGVRAYQKEGKNKLTLTGYNGCYLIRLETGPDFADTINFMEETLRERKDIFSNTWGSIPKLERRNYQDPKNLFLE